MKLIKHFLKSFSHAYRGIRDMLVQEPSFLIQMIIAVIVIGLAIYLKVTGFEWLLLLTIIGAVLSFEIFNTTIERLINFIHPEEHPQIKVIKDISAAAVLISSIMALIIGLIIFIPYF